MKATNSLITSPQVLTDKYKEISESSFLYKIIFYTLKLLENDAGL